MPFEIRLFTYGQMYGTPKMKGTRVIYTVDCSDLPSPPRSLCKILTGLDRQIAEDFWSYSVNRKRYNQALDDIENILLNISGRRQPLGIGVFCVAGTHRSVAMAERLARCMSGWKGVWIRNVVHFDLAAEEERALRRERLRKKSPKGEEWVQERPRSLGLDCVSNLLDWQTCIALAVLFL